MINVIAIAAVCHEANRALCYIDDDESQPAWEDAPDWQVESAINGVEHAIRHQDITPEEMHANWMAGKIADGWTYGDVKDPVAKTHPCIRPYDMLPWLQQKKDVLFLAIVRALA
jgi:hypothetical protein